MNAQRCKDIAALLAARNSGLTAEEAQRVTDHIAICPDCAWEADVLERMAALLDRAPSVTTPAEREQIIAAALTKTAHVTSSSRIVTRRALQAAGAAALIVAAGMTVGVWPGHTPRWPETQTGRTPRRRSGPTPWAASLASGKVEQGTVLNRGTPLQQGAAIPPTAELTARKVSQLQLGHARLRTRAGTRLRWNGEGLRLTVLRGAVSARVHPAGRGPFVVENQHFVVVVSGTRFHVDERQVHVLSGSVRVEDREGAVLRARLTAGQTYRAEPSAPAVARGDPQRASTAPPRRAAPRSAPRPAARLLLQARQRLARGHGDGVAPLLKQVLQSSPTAGERAEALTLWAEWDALGGRPQQAVQRYLEVARIYRATAAGENALYAAARLARRYSSGDTELLLRYIERYPDGRFAPEVRRLLAQPGHDGSPAAHHGPP